MSTLSTFCRYSVLRLPHTNVRLATHFRMWNRGHFVSPLAQPRKGPRPLLAPLCLSPGCCCASGSPFPWSALLVLACLVPVSGRGRLHFGVGHNDRKREGEGKALDCRRRRCQNGFGTLRSACRALALILNSPHYTHYFRERHFLRNSPAVHHRRPTYRHGDGSCIIDGNRTAKRPSSFHPPA